ncbi:hypothetical protein VM1G_09430 [Cytospora mali]|uniref:Uncharacterized protein n=1 Tax=Cytospora mali TaxID=578113 RepID=A0A194WBP9_CYTMA|nr:hypothetical protein VM1G_09430 [Valsa mali]
MRLYSRNWAPLLDRQGYHVTFEALLVFLRETRKYVNSTSAALEETSCNPYDWPLGNDTDETPNKFTSWPEGPQLLTRVFAMWQMDSSLLSQSPMSIITNANFRECTSSRAPAIMSALGVTEWYSHKLARTGSGHQGKMVFGVYELEFMQEAARKFGGAFFHTRPRPVARLGRRHLITRSGVGSMLPFLGRRDWSARIMASRTIDSEGSNLLDVINHESVAGWEICTNGAVKVSSAGILASSEKQSDGLNIKTLFEWDEDLDGMNSTDDFGEKLKELAREGIVYAVSLYEDHNFQYGNLLYSPQTTVFGKRYLLKMGAYRLNYRLNGYDEKLRMPPSTAVNWVVL